MARFEGISVPAGATPEIVAALKAVEDFIFARETAPQHVPVFTVSNLPLAEDWTECVIGVSDESGGYTLAQSDGSDWLRVKDGAVVT